jgi:predicted transcriptional regulator
VKIISIILEDFSTDLIHKRMLLHIQNLQVNHQKSLAFAANLPTENIRRKVPHQDPE